MFCFPWSQRIKIQSFSSPSPICLESVFRVLTLVLHKISNSKAYRAVYKVLHGISTELSLVILSKVQKKSVQRLRCCYRGGVAVLGWNFMQLQDLLTVRETVTGKLNPYLQHIRLPFIYWQIDRQGLSNQCTPASIVSFCKNRLDLIFNGNR